MAPKPEPKKPGKKPDDGVVHKIQKLLGLTPPPKTPVPGFMYRIKNLLKCHYRGLLGWTLVILLFVLCFEKHDLPKKIEVMWTSMILLFIVRPINPPVVAFFPLFFLPMTGTIGSRETCVCYMNADIALYLLTSMVMLLLNNCGNDRRLALSIMSFGDADQHSMKKMVYKCSTSAYLLGMLSNRLVSSSMITEYFTTAMMSLEKKYGTSEAEPDLEEIRFVVNSAIHTSSAIGSIAIVHAATPTLCFRAIFHESVPDKEAEYEDLFNYLQYTVFAFPVSLIIFVLNLFYHMILIDRQAEGEMTSACTTLLQKALAARKAELPKQMTLHEKLCISGLILWLFTHAYRWNYWLGGWTEYIMDEKSTEETPLPYVKDATVAAIFAVLLHSLPNGFSFVKYTVVSKRKDLPKPKAESGILWWKYVDKNVNYGYFFLIGCGVAIMVSALTTGLCDIIGQNSGCMITDRSWNVGILIVILGASVVSNIVSSTAGCCIFLPFVLCAALKGPDPWGQRAYLVALGVGIGSSFGYACPYLYTPAYFCHYVGKVPKAKMMSYSIISTIISVIVLWLALLYYAPMIWDPSDKGHTFLGTTTLAPDAGGGPPPE
ncbi:unnamed protein product [Arctia plantaginis]|uniref:Citrate transporter-like domain-containing protein n=1 Tax=Arctia plantaginis TaxID=874455 RepID=A0A8S1B263_ARCPL|nr:unnamed protein product [Arctia plantaginis]